MKLNHLISRSAGLAAIAACSIVLTSSHAGAQSGASMHRAKAKAQALQSSQRGPQPASSATSVPAKTAPAKAASPVKAVSPAPTKTTVTAPARISKPKSPASGARTRQDSAAVAAPAPVPEPKSVAIVMTPTTPPTEVAAILATKAPGERVIHLSGFGGDVAAYDTVKAKPSDTATVSMVSTGAPSEPSDAKKTAPPATEPPELLKVGTATVRARVKESMIELRDAGGKVDAFTVEVPSTLPAGPVAEAVLSKAVDAAVKEVYPEAKAPERTLSVEGTGASSEGGIASGPGTVHDGTGQIQPDERETLAQSTRSKALLALQSVPDVRRTTDWSGSLSYRAREWNRIFELARDSSALRQQLMAVANGARERLLNADPALYRRPATLAQIHPTLLDGRAANAGPNREVFALAMADCGQSAFVRQQGVELAIAASYLHDADCLAKCIDILSACRDRFPLQRPGWTAYDPSSVLPEGGDGVWLATSWGISGIVDMLTILGDQVPATLRNDLDMLLRKEVDLIARDWADQRPWYVRSRATQSNQWIEPCTGLVKATLYLGDPRLLPAYNLGVEGLAASLSTQGADGAFMEGLSYASMTVGILFDVLEDLKQNGDMRCHSIPFVGNSWKWFTHMLMPGRQYVNTYDSRMSSVPDWALVTPHASAMSAALGSGDPQALPTLRALYPQGNASIPGVRYQAAIDSLPPSESMNALPTFSHFGSQQQVVWRSAWEAPAAIQRGLGLFVRGGSARDSHCHRDQGQVSIYNGDRIVLMDCGTPDYSTPDLNQRYANAAGHGIMQVGALPRTQAVDAPISVAQLDATGGRVLVDTTAAYSGVTSCTREVQWGAGGEVRIDDRVRLGAAVPQGTELYRFHTGSADTVQITSENGEWTVSWPGAVMRMTASAPITVEQTQWPDAVKPPFMHQAIIVRCTGPTTDLDLATVVTVDRSMASVSP